MNSKRDQFSIASFLQDMRQKLGDTEFGYRAQGLLAHVLARIGAVIIDIRAQGHPDIYAKLLGQLTPFEVEVAPAISRTHVLKAEDIEAISPKGTSAGYLAVLDCAIPLSWALVHHGTLKRLGPRPTPLVTVRAMSEKQLSQQCTDEFLNLVADHHDKMSTLSFHILRERALRGECL